MISTNAPLEIAQSPSSKCLGSLASPVPPRYIRWWISAYCHRFYCFCVGGVGGEGSASYSTNGVRGEIATVELNHPPADSMTVFRSAFFRRTLFRPHLQAHFLIRIFSSMHFFVTQFFVPHFFGRRIARTKT